MRRYIIGMLMILLVTPLLTLSGEASGSNAPEIRAYQDGNSAKIEWAVEMVDNDVLYETGFEEEDLLPTLAYGNSDVLLEENRKFGGQEFTKEEKYDGQRSLRVNDSYSNSNIHSQALDGSIVISANDSWSDFRDSRFMVPNKTDLSLSFRAKTNGNGHVRFTGTGGAADYGTPVPGVTFSEDVKVGDRTVKVNNIATFKSAIDRGARFYIALSKGRYSYGYVTSYNQANSTITLNTGFRGEFKAGESILRHNSRSPVSFSSREVNASDGWSLFNVNTAVANYADYNTALRGFYLTIRTTTRDLVYIDDVKVGYATSAELHRDGVKIYEGRLSDYDDKAATDKARPDKIKEYELREEEGRTFVKLTKPADYGTSYDYVVKAVSRKDGQKYDSQTSTVNVNTGIKGYSYLIDKNAESTPTGIIHSTEEEVEIPNSITPGHYLHVQAIDGAGNKSEVTHIALDKIDRTPPIAYVDNIPDNWIRTSLTFRLYAEDNQEVFSIEDHTGELLKLSRRSDYVLVDYTVDNNGEYDFIITDVAGNKTTYTVVVDKIDKVDPELSLITNIDGWTNESIIIKAIAEDSTSGVDSVIVSRDFEDVNLISIKDIMRWQAEEYEVNDREIIVSSDSRNMAGIHIPYDFIEEGEEYVLSFEITKLSGEMPVIGGHLAISTSAEVLIDGKPTENTRGIVMNEWHTPSLFPNDNLRHRVDVRFAIDDYENHDNKNIYIQPNRSTYLHEYSAKIENVMLSKGREILPYEPNSRDLISGENPLLYEATQNGTYSFIATDNAGNTSTKSIVIDNIDKSAPSVKITQNTDEITHDNIILTVDAQDAGSGVDSVMYRGDNMVFNGDFTHGFNGWSKDVGREGFSFEDGKVLLEYNGHASNKIWQFDAFTGSALGTRYYAEITARGEGILNARYGIGKGQQQRDYSQSVRSDYFQTYTFLMDRNDNNNDNLVIESLGEGWIEIDEIKVYGQSDITDTRTLEVTNNGSYTFIVEDLANNITSKTHVVNNIDKTISMEAPSIGTLADVTLSGDIEKLKTQISSVNVKDWRDTDNKWKMNVSSTQLTNGSHKLPKGTIKLNPLSSITMIDASGDSPEKSFTSIKAIDDGVVELASNLSGRGEYKLTFPNNALEIDVDTSIANKGDYTATITWDLVTAP